MDSFLPFFLSPPFLSPGELLSPRGSSPNGLGWLRPSFSVLSSPFSFSDLHSSLPYSSLGTSSSLCVVICFRPQPWSMAIEFPPCLTRAKRPLGKLLMHYMALRGAPASHLIPSTPLRRPSRRSWIRQPWLLTD